MDRLDWRPVSGPSDLSGLRPVDAMILVGVHFGAAIAVVGIAAALGGGERQALLNDAAAVVAGPLAALYLGLWRHAAAEATIPALRLARPRGGERTAVAAGVVAGAALAPLAVSVTALTLARWPDAAAAEAAAEAAAGQPGKFALVAALAGRFVAGPFVEELLYRGFVQPRLSLRVGPLRALVLTAVLYTAVQVDPRWMPAALLLAVPLGLFAWRGRTAWVPVAAHLAYGAAWLALPSVPRLDVALVLAAVAGGATWVGWRALAGGRARRGSAPGSRGPS
jgi:membrane protease YdiL (CAAX protease family)